jgi:hypothetical protein
MGRSSRVRARRRISMKNEQRGARLREALATAERAGAGRPYPESLRAAALEYRQERELEGAGLRLVAAELGLNVATLERWSGRKAGNETSFRAIEIVGERMWRENEVVVHGPRGLRIEGLTLGEIAELVERLS